MDEELSVNTMYNLFLNSYQIQVSYVVYWTGFKNEYNLRFGLPRTGTYDTYRLKIKLAALDETKAILKMNINYIWQKLTNLLILDES